MKKVLLDTSFLLKCTEYHIDLYSEIRRVCDFQYELAYIDKTVEELDSIIEHSPKFRSHAKVAKLFLKRAKSVKTTGDLIVDDLLIDYAKAHPNTVIATHDAELKRRAKALGRPLIYIRQKKYLVFSAA